MNIVYRRSPYTASDAEAGIRGGEVNEQDLADAKLGALVRKMPPGAGLNRWQQPNENGDEWTATITRLYEGGIYGYDAKAHGVTAEGALEAVLDNDPRSRL